jgi:hypothetical protein
MFYHGSVENKLRFGDVVKGYPIAIPKIEKPIIDSSTESYGIDIKFPRFAVVLDPCCEIGKGMISLSPLEEVTRSFWDISYLVKDMTLVNVEGMANDLVHPVVWNRFSDSQKINALVSVPSYGYTPYFVFEGNPLFPEYTVEREMKYLDVLDEGTQLPKYEVSKESSVYTTRHRMMCFKNVYRVNCQKIFGSEKPTDETIQKSIVLQLSIKARNQLRDKMAFYFGNKPKEDRLDL